MARLPGVESDRCVTSGGCVKTGAQAQSRFESSQLPRAGGSVAPTGRMSRGLAREKGVGASWVVAVVAVLLLVGWGWWVTCALLVVAALNCRARDGWLKVTLHLIE